MDISTVYTKKCNRDYGRKGYYRFKYEKVTDITPKHYGEFLLSRKGREINGINRNVN